MEERKIESGGQEMEEDNTELNSNLSNGRWKQVRKKDIDKTWKKTRLNSAQTSLKEDGRKEGRRRCTRDVRRLKPLKWKMEGRHRWKKARQRLKPLKWTHTLCPESCDPSDTAAPCKDSHF